MNLIQRVKETIGGCIHRFLDRIEDPKKVLDQSMANLEATLFKVSGQTADIMAEEKRSKRELDHCQKEIDSLLRYARIAKAKGEHQEACQLLEEKLRLEARKEDLVKIHENAVQSSEQMKALLRKLQNQYRLLAEKKKYLEAQINIANTKQLLSRYSFLGESSMNKNGTAFSRIEEKIMDMTDRAESLEELMTQEENPVCAKYQAEEKNETLRKLYDQLDLAV